MGVLLFMKQAPTHTRKQKFFANSKKIGFGKIFSQKIVSSIDFWKLETQSREPVGNQFTEIIFPKFFGAKNFVIKKFLERSKIF